MLMRWISLLLFMGCGFRIEPGAAIDPRIDAAFDAQIDAPIDPTIDAAIDAAIDAPIDAMIDAPTTPAAFCDANDPNLRACYRFDNSLTDGSMYSNGAGGTASYATIGAHMGLSLNAAASTVSVASNSSLSTAQFTLKMWIRPNSVPASASARMGLLDNNKWRMFVQMGGTIRCAINDGSIEVLTLVPVLVNVWTRVTCTYGGGALKVYLNGIEQGSTPANTGLDGLSTPTTIGLQEPSGDTFSGLIDDVQIFSAVVAP